MVETAPQGTPKHDQAFFFSWHYCFEAGATLRDVSIASPRGLPRSSTVDLHDLTMSEPSDLDEAARVSSRFNAASILRCFPVGLTCVSPSRRTSLDPPEASRAPQPHVTSGHSYEHLTSSSCTCARSFSSSRRRADAASSDLSAFPVTCRLYLLLLPLDLGPSISSSYTGSNPYSSQGSTLSISGACS